MSQRRPISTTLPEGVWRRMGCCEGDYTVFQTRIGPDYKCVTCGMLGVGFGSCGSLLHSSFALLARTPRKHGKKGPSDPPLFVPVGLDLFRTKRKVRGSEEEPLLYGCALALPRL